MQGADLYDSLMRGAKLTQAQMESADLRFAQMQEADLFEAKLQRANLRETNLRGAILVGANMHEADLSGAQLQKANLRAARLNGATLDFTVITGDPAAENVRLSPELRMSRNIPGLASIDLSMATNNGGMLRFVDMTEIVFDDATDFRNVFLDGSVSMTAEFRARMGNPCQWVDRRIEDDAEFYGRWRGWIEAARDDLYAPDWKSLAPSGFEDVEAVRPSPFCKWKTGPMP
jgi:uncharacterized protein YjbI with pentapeptide repeats